MRSHALISTTRLSQAPSPGKPAHVVGPKSKDRLDLSLSFRVLFYWRFVSCWKWEEDIEKVIGFLFFCFQGQANEEAGNTRLFWLFPIPLTLSVIGSKEKEEEKKKKKITKLTTRVAVPEGGTTGTRTPKFLFNIFFFQFYIRMLQNKAQIALESI